MFRSRHFQHYAFSHRALPGLVFKTPVRSFHQLYINNPERVLSALWDSVADEIKSLGFNNRLSFSSLTLERLLIADHPCLIVGMPKPRRQREAHYVAIVWYNFLKTNGTAKLQAKTLRVYILERGSQVVFAPKAVLHEWLPHDNQPIRAQALTPDKSTFIRNLEEVIRHISVVEGLGQK